MISIQPLPKSKLLYINVSLIHSIIHNPSQNPSSYPTISPSSTPLVTPTSLPSDGPSMSPMVAPSVSPLCWLSQMYCGLQLCSHQALSHLLLLVCLVLFDLLSCLMCDDWSEWSVVRTWFEVTDLSEQTGIVVMSTLVPITFMGVGSYDKTRYYFSTHSHKNRFYPFYLPPMFISHLPLWSPSSPTTEENYRKKRVLSDTIV